ncbi:MAG: redox-regulated ATPase YchF [Elusimicrobia bacterium]|nr:redox-regulated ATPase YchF [Elusimicrobiota bacterium]
MEIGIVGLANSGKSTLFNALTRAGAASSSYPFSTKDANVGTVQVPDRRLDALFELFKPPKKVPSYIKFVDVAGLVQGASRGEGLGNKFLGTIREVDVIAHVVRCFRDPNVVHVLNSVDPLRDAEIVETELMLADLEAVEKMLDKNSGDLKSGKKEAKERQEKLEKLKALLAEGRFAGEAGYTAEETRDFNLLTTKPVFYAANTDEKPDPIMLGKLRDFAKARGIKLVEISAKIESELIELPEEEKRAFLKDMGEEYTGLEKMILAGKELLKIINFFTVGEDEVRAWTLRQGLKAPQAAGRVHTDMEKGFIRTEVYSVEDIEKYRDEKTLKEKGLIRSEGREYVIKDGDICFFKFSPH